MEQQLKEFQGIYDQIAEFLVNYSFQIIGAIIVLLLGMVVSRKFGRMVEEFMIKHNIDVTLSRFTGTAVRILIVAMVAVIALGKVGISVAPFVAAIGAVGLGAGLAMQGILSNYGAGVAIIITRPFVVGDTITVKGVTGLVKEVRMASTILANQDDIRIMIPNHHIMGEIIHNSAAETIVEMTLEVAYDSDPLRAVELIKAALASNPHISTTRPPQAGIHDFGNNGYRLGLRYWTGTARLFQTRCAANAAIYQTLRDHGIAIPLPQREVHMVADKSA
ncbi:MAG TPA: mechanosensitive ion channel domain-containing protein [Candidatus Acidoferrum sp.]|nr:mechanosensitive ion channel domain-containing protein [Candidatus Acidoferrum sp.]